MRRHPEFVDVLDDDDALAVEATRAELVADALDTLEWRGDQEQRREGLRRFKRRELLRIATRDLLGYARLEATERELTGLAEACLEAALRSLRPTLPFAVIGMGRLGGGELSYASDIDVMFVYDGDSADDFHHAEHVAAQLVQEIGATTAEGQTFRIDARLRPEGNQGPLARSIGGFRQYYAQWGLTWERQALTKARFVAGDAELGARFAEVAAEFTYGQPMTDDDVREIRRMKARIERERIPPGEDPQFHLKLGRGSLSDVEFTVQLLQLVHGGEHPDVRVPGTIDALERLRAHDLLDADDTEVLEEAYRFCERARNAHYLQTAHPSDALPADKADLERLALLLGYVHRPHSVLRDDYRRVTRRARRRRRTRLLRHLMTTATLEAMGARTGGPCRAPSCWPCSRWSVSAIAMVLRVGGDYRPTADEALDRAADPRHRPPRGAARALLPLRLVPPGPAPLLPALAAVPHHRQHRVRASASPRSPSTRSRCRRHRVRRPPTAAGSRSSLLTLFFVGLLERRRGRAVLPRRVEPATSRCCRSCCSCSWRGR